MYIMAVCGTVEKKNGKTGGLQKMGFRIDQNK